MADFLEERLLGCLRYGASYADEYKVSIIETSGGQEYRSLTHPYPKRSFDVSYLLERDELYVNLLGLYHRAHGMYAGFRAHCLDEYSSNGATGVPTSFDQPMGLVSAGVYQLRKYYGTDGLAGGAGFPYRNVYKPVAGTVQVAIGATEIRPEDWSVVTSTGVVTFAADQTYSVTGLASGTTTEITIGAHTLVTGQSVHVSGVVGSPLPAYRALILGTTPTTIVVQVDTTGFTYTSGGVVHTRPQEGEPVTAGFEFDFPVRFNTVLPIGMDYPNHRTVDGVQLVELLNP